MAKIVKEFSRRESAGYAEERLFERKKNGNIGFGLKFDVDLIPFAMDVQREWFIIFMIKREHDPSLFLWVYLERDHPEKSVRITTIREVDRSISGPEPLDCSGKYSEDIISRALEILYNCPISSVIFSAADASMDMRDPNDRPAFKKHEKVIFEMVKKAKLQNKGIVHR